MSRMAELHTKCIELGAMMEDGSIDFDEAVEILCEEFPVLKHEDATTFLLNTFEDYNHV